MRRALYRAALALAVIATAAGAAVAYTGYTARPGPAEVVRSYFAALAAGDAPAALALGVVPAGPHDFLTGAVLAEQQRIAPLRDVSVGPVALDGDAAVVAYRYRLAFAAGTTTVRGSTMLRRHGSSWRLASVATPVTTRVRQAVDRITFADTSVPRSSVLLFPGALPIRLDTTRLGLSPARAAVPLGDATSVALRVRASHTVGARVRAAVRKRLAACVDDPAATLSCPLPSGRFVPGGLSGRLVAAPRLRLTVTAADAGVVAVTGTARFRGAYQRLGYDNVAHTRHGALSLPISASSYAVGPLRLTWRRS